MAPADEPAGATKQIITAVIRSAGEWCSRKHALQQSELLRDSQNRLLIDLAPEAIVVYDAGLGTIVDANALNLFGCEREELFRTSPVSFYTFTLPDGLPPLTSFRHNTNRVLAGEVLTFEDL